jgi:signal peptidase I
MSMVLPLDRSDVVTCELAAEVLRTCGLLRLPVRGWSMLPTVWPGDTLMIEPVESDAVREGDIVLFSRNGRLVAHRMLSKSGSEGDAKILTRGDALPHPDLIVSDRDLLGRVAFIIRNGKHIEPSRRPRFSHRAVAGLIRQSETAARAAVRVRSMCQDSPIHE